VTKLKPFSYFFYEVFKASLGFYCYSKLNKAQAEKLMGSNLAACCIKMRANNFMGERLLLAQARSGSPALQKVCKRRDGIMPPIKHFYEVCGIVEWVTDCIYNSGF
jgi:hypothetical protein